MNEAVLNNVVVILLTLPAAIREKFCSFNALDPSGRRCPPVDLESEGLRPGVLVPHRHGAWGAVQGLGR